MTLKQEVMNEMNQISSVAESECVATANFVTSENDGWVYHFAKFVTNLGCPPFTLVAGSYVIGSTVSEPGALQTAGLIGFAGGIAPLLVLLFLHARGRITSLDLESAADRRIGFSLGMGCAGLMYAFLPSDSIVFSNFLVAHLLATALLFLCTSITMKFGWKASVHSAGAGCLMYLSMYAQIWGAMIWGPIVFLVISWSRLYLGKHTLSQVLLGAVLGIGVYASFF